MNNNNYLGCEIKVEKGEAGYVLEDVLHLTDYIPDLPVCLFLLFLLSDISVGVIVEIYSRCPFHD